MDNIKENLAVELRNKIIIHDKKKMLYNSISAHVESLLEIEDGIYIDELDNYFHTLNTYKRKKQELSDEIDKLKTEEKLIAKDITKGIKGTYDIHGYSDLPTIILDGVNEQEKLYISWEEVPLMGYSVFMHVELRNTYFGGEQVYTIDCRVD